MKGEKKNIGITAEKEKNFPEWFSQVVFKALLADNRYGIQGFIVHREWGMKILRRIYEMLEKEVEKDNHEPVLFPVAIPEKFLAREKEHVEGFAPEVFWVTRAGNGELAEPFALRPTSETAFYSMYSLWIRSWKDLPFKRYQSRICVYRNESQTKPFLRGREFMFFETHCAFSSHEEAEKQILRDMEIMKSVAGERLFIPFVFFKRPAWDKFAGADSTYAADCVMPDGRVSQIGTTHDLGQRFSRAFEITFKDRDMKEKHAFITCFGPGIWRLLAAVIAIHGDDKGLVLPSSVAPYHCVIVPIYFSGKEEEVEKYAMKIKELLSAQGFAVFLDSRRDETPGFKFNKWELMGVPLRIELGPKEVEKGTAILARRADGKKIETTIEKLPETVSCELKANDEIIKERSTRYHRIEEAKTMAELEEISRKGGFVKVPFCSIGEDGRECAEKLQEALQLKVRGIPLGEEEGEYGKCIVCGENARYMVWVAKAY